MWGALDVLKRIMTQENVLDELLVSHRGLCRRVAVVGARRHVNIATRTHFKRVTSLRRRIRDFAIRSREVTLPVDGVLAGGVLSIRGHQGKRSGIEVIPASAREVFAVCRTRFTVFFHGHGAL